MVLQIDEVTKRFGEVVANDAVSLRIAPGEVVGVLGHNGAGKTTLVSQIVGLLRPDVGTVRVGGVDAVADPTASRRQVALQAQAQAPLDGLTPRRAIELAGRLRGLAHDRARASAARVAEELDITEWLDRRATPDGGGVSGGVRRLTAFAMAAVAPAPLIALDEPSNDVDAGRRRHLWDAVRRLGDEGAGVLLVTHNVVEAERVVDSLVVLDRGRVVATGTPSQLRGHHDRDLRLELTLAPDLSDPATLGAPPVPVLRHVTAARRALLTIPTEQAAAAVAWASDLRAAGAVDDFALAPATLEDAYLAVTAAPAGPTPTRA